MQNEIFKNELFSIQISKTVQKFKVNCIAWKLNKSVARSNHKLSVLFWRSHFLNFLQSFFGNERLLKNWLTLNFLFVNNNSRTDLLKIFQHANRDLIYQKWIQESFKLFKLTYLIHEMSVAWPHHSKIRICKTVIIGEYLGPHFVSCFDIGMRFTFCGLFAVYSEDTC